MTDTWLFICREPFLVNMTSRAPFSIKFNMFNDQKNQV